MQVGQVISGKYRLVRLLGDGGMGSVFEAHHEKLGTRVAIKFLHAELARHAGLVERFLQEARVAAQITSPHVVRVTDIDQTPEGAAYIVMDLLEGEALSQVLERERKVPVPVACDYTKQILEALEAAHALGVVHRDLKPENVFVTFVAGRPVLKLIDFGIAKLRQSGAAQKNLTVAGVLMGTAEYMAPEQAFSADKVDARSDIYSVGVMLYEMIAGVRPVSGEDARVIAMKVERGDVRPLVHAEPTVPREIAGLAHRAMAARPELRFASAAEMRLALEGALHGKRPPTVPLAASPDLSKMEAGTGTVMGAPAQALLGANAGAHGAAHVPPPRPHETAHARPHATPVASPAGPLMPSPPPPRPRVPGYDGDDDREPPRRSRAPLVAGILLLGLVALGAIVASQTDVLSRLGFGGGDAPTATVVVPPPPPPPPPATASAPGSAAPAPTDSLAPLVTPKTPPVGPTPPNPTPKPHPSGAPSGSSSGTPDTPPPPNPFPFPSGLPPFPMPSGSAFPFPTTIPPFPIPLPNFNPPTPTPAPTTSAGN